jgi:hypothetical protein
MKSIASEFETIIESDFRFLKTDMGFACSGVRTEGDDPRDSYLLARFSRGEERVDVAWNEMAMSLSILIRVANDDLERKERYIYFEPFVEYISNGTTLPIAPQLFPRFTLKAIEATMRQRELAYQKGIANSMKLLSKKLSDNLASVLSTTPESIRSYQQWYANRTS